MDLACCHGKRYDVISALKVLTNTRVAKIFIVCLHNEISFFGIFHRFTNTIATTKPFRTSLSLCCCEFQINMQANRMAYCRITTRPPKKKNSASSCFHYLWAKFILFWFWSQPIPKLETDIQKWLWPGLTDILLANGDEWRWAELKDGAY